MYKSIYINLKNIKLCIIKLRKGSIMKKLLPFKYPVIIDAYSGAAGTVGILSNCSESTPWIISNFIGMGTNNKSFDNRSFLYFVPKAYQDSPWIEAGYITFDRQQNNLFDLFIDSINSDKYIRLYLDHYYIKESSRYQRFHFLHDNATILGYDLQKQVFHVADNFIWGKFVILEIPFSEINDAIRNTGDADKLEIQTLSLNKSAKYLFNLSLFLQIIEEYLCSNYVPLNDFMDPSYKDCIYGLESYNYLKKYLELLSENSALYDLRGFHVLVNHMAVLLLSVDYLKDRELLENYDSIRNSITDLQNKCLLARTMLIKFGKINDNSILKRIKDIIEQVSIGEKTVLEQIIKSTNSNK